jgi:hypothetical protein
MSGPVPAFAIHLPSLSRLFLHPPQSLRESFIDILPFNNSDSVQPSILVSPNKQCSVFIAVIYSYKNRSYIKQGHLLPLDILQYSNFILHPSLVSTPNVSHALIQTFPTRNIIPPLLPASLIAFVKDTETAIAKRHWSDVYSTENSHT